MALSLDYQRCMGEIELHHIAMCNMQKKQLSLVSEVNIHPLQN